jgi:GT2 family glycosyltransferase
MQTNRLLEIVIVAYGPPGLLDTCLTALGPDAAPVVVDNSSSPLTRSLVSSRGGRYLDPGRNLGFGAGVNFALTHAVHPGADVLLLNPDAAISLFGIGELHRHLLADASLACVAPAQVDPSDGRSARVCWPLPSPTGAWLDALGLGSHRRGQQFLIGAVLLLRAEALAEIGPFDERFFLYAEETDWEMRALQKGWKVQVCSDVVATHLGAGTGGDPLTREVHFHASHERLVRKHYGALGWQAYRSAAICGALVRAVVRRGHPAKAAITRLRLYLRSPCRCELLLASRVEPTGSGKPAGRQG